MKNISLRAFPIEGYLGLLEVTMAGVIEYGDCEPVADEQSVMDVLIGGVQVLHSTHAHAERNHFPLLWTSVHDFVFCQHF